jgi:hypothetical protein
VVPGETGLLVPPQRPDLMADAVEYLLDRPAVAARMAADARARLGDRFGVAALRDALTAAYTGPPADGQSPGATQTAMPERTQPVTSGDSPDLSLPHLRHHLRSNARSVPLVLSSASSSAMSLADRAKSKICAF